jgi:hypothetical protein
MIDGSPETLDHREIDTKTGMQKGYVVLCPEERAKGFVKPLRDSYKHLPCNNITYIGTAIAETYARDPNFYNGTFCCHCKDHFPLREFVWAEDGESLEVKKGDV